VGDPITVGKDRPGSIELGTRTALGSRVQTTVLTVHVKKADVDAFAEDTLTFKDFRDRATIVTY